MAIDSRSKRASILGIGLAAGLALPLVDGSVDQPDRQHVTFSYAGIQAGNPTIVTPADYFRVTAVSRFFRVTAVCRFFVVQIP